MKKIRYIAFIALTLILYIGWMKGGDRIYGKVITTGIESFTAKFSSIESAEIKYYEEAEKSLIFCKYDDRTTKINLEFCLPIVLLLAWQFSLFFDKRIPRKSALKFLGINFLILFFLQIFFPLLLYNVSQSTFKSTSLFIGLQIFGFLVFFLILKDSLIIKYFFSDKQQQSLS